MSGRPVYSHPEQQDALNATPGPSRLEDFEHDWYIRVKFQYQDLKRADRAAAIVKMESEVVTLFDRLHSALAAYNIKLWPERLVDDTDESDDERCTCYWVLGLPTFPPSDLAASKHLLREWQISFKDEALPIKYMVQARFIPRKVFMQHTMSPVGNKAIPQDTRRSGDTFKKIPGSNPHQIRRQFLQHVMGSDGTQDRKIEPSIKLRPAKEVLKKLKNDPMANPDDYVIGYIDRKAGILEKPISAWESFDQEDLIAYFRQASEDRIIWDRAKKIDHLFAS